MTYQVLWDGTPHRKYGRLLFGPESAPAKQVERTPERSLSGIVREFLSTHHGWYTSHEIAEATGLGVEAANHGISGLVAMGLLEREHLQGRRGRINGTTRQRYRWVVR